MGVERILDASTAAAALFHEVQTPRARERLSADIGFSAPDLLFVEMASIASKKVRRGEITRAEADHALERIPDLLIETAPSFSHYHRAFAFAVEHGFSAYDGLYLAMAEARGVPLITADEKLIRRAEGCGLSALVEPL